jgi:pyridoxine 5-phosphate synthase
MKHCDLGVNIDHVATLRQARGTSYPSPLEAALVAESSGADGITLHLREDRRHIQDADVEAFRERLQTRMNLEIAATEDMVAIAEKVRPFAVCLVPERREELTTEGGLDVLSREARITELTTRLTLAGCRVSLFIDPEDAQIAAAARCGAAVVELHTGRYANLESGSSEQLSELERLREGASRAHSLGLIVHAGHGLTLDNVAEIAAIDVISELNIGHSLIADAVFVGLPEAVQRMRQAINQARQ